MHSTVAQFSKQCGTCALIKDSIQYAHRALQPLLLPPAQFHSYNLDFITYFPLAWGLNCVLTIIDHLTKLMYLIPCTMWKNKLSAAQITKLLFENNVRFLVVLKKLVHNRAPRFTAQFWL